MVSAEVLKKLEEGFTKLKNSKSKSLLKKYLTKSVFEKLKNKQTSFKSTLLDCIQSGFKNQDSHVGVYAPDEDAYKVFADLFDPVIEDYHLGFKQSDCHPPSNWGNPNNFKNLDPDDKYIISTRIRCARSVSGFPFNPCLKEKEYLKLEEVLTESLCNLGGEYGGQYHPLLGMNKEVQQKLIDDHFLFKEGDRFLEAAKSNRFWPKGRGIYLNKKKTFLAWVNEEDHMRIISMQKGGDICEIYSRLLNAVSKIEDEIKFARSDRFGYLTFCPTNLGTTIRASVHIKVPNIAKDKAALDKVANKYNLQVRGTRGEHTEAEGGVYDISNKRRLGLTEYDAVNEMYSGIREIIKLEKKSEC